MVNRFSLNFISILFSSSLIPPYHQNLYDILVKTIATTQQQSMNTNQIEINNEVEESQVSSKEKRATYMSQLRGSCDSEYRRMERENNARAMRKKRSENPLYREQERRQNRAHMAEIRRDNSEYRQKEHNKNRHRMALKRNLLSQPSINNDSTRTTSMNSNVINSIYQTLEINLQSSHISFIPYQSSSSIQQRRSNNNKRRNEVEFLEQIDEYCRQQDTGSSSDSNSRSTTSMSSSC
jgi:hypothetical protein